MSAREDMALIRGALDYDCDAISQAIGEGCGQCAGCDAYAALARVEAELADKHAMMRAAIEDAEAAEGELARLKRVEASIQGKTAFTVVAEKVDAEIKLDRALARAEAAEADAARLRDGLRTAGADFLRIRDRIEEKRNGEAASIAYDSWYRCARALLGSTGDTAARCEKCRHDPHEPGSCEANLGTGYMGPVLCRCGAEPRP